MSWRRLLRSPSNNTDGGSGSRSSAPHLTVVYTVAELVQAILDDERHIIIRTHMDMILPANTLDLPFAAPIVSEHVKSIRVRSHMFLDSPPFLVRNIVSQAVTGSVRDALAI